jgi:hypothetical protein
LRLLDEPEFIASDFRRTQLGGNTRRFGRGQQPERVSAVVNLDEASPMTALAREKYEQLFVEIELKGFRPVVARFLSESFFCRTSEEPLASKLSPTCFRALKILPMAWLSSFLFWTRKKR